MPENKDGYDSEKGLVSTCHNTYVYATKKQVFSKCGDDISSGIVDIYRCFECDEECQVKEATDAK